MRFYKHTHAFYCGVDLHARSMFTHILDHDGKTVFEGDLPAGPETFRNAIAPYRAGLVVGWSLRKEQPATELVGDSFGRLDKNWV